MRRWWERHVTRCDKPDWLTWAQCAPVCPLCKFALPTALQEGDFVALLQWHYTVCRGVPVGEEVHPMPDHPETKSWTFSSRSPLRFKWNPTSPRVFWVYAPADDGEPVLIGGYKVYRPTYEHDEPTHGSAIEMSKRYIRRWEQAPDKREVYSENAIKGSMLDYPSDHYLSRRMMKSPAQEMLKERAGLIAAMFDLTQAKALTRLEILCGELPAEGWEEAIKEGFRLLTEVLTAAESKLDASSENPKPASQKGPSKPPPVLSLFD